MADDTGIDWTIEPLVGVGPLRFGQSTAEVANLIGPALTTQTGAGLPAAVQDFLGQGALTEYRLQPGADIIKSMPNVAYHNDVLDEIIFVEIQHSLNFAGIEFYHGVIADNILRLVELSQRLALTEDGTYFFLDLGISMLSEDLFEFSEPISVFARGHYDSFVEEAIAKGDCRMIKG